MRLLALIFPALLGLFLIVVLGAAYGAIIMLLWNFLFVGAGSIIGVSLPALTWFQGWMLSILSSLLFKSSSSSSSSSS